LHSVEVMNLKLESAAQARDARLKVTCVLKERCEGRGCLDGSRHGALTCAADRKCLATADVFPGHSCFWSPPMLLARSVLHQHREVAAVLLTYGMFMSGVLALAWVIA
ncbi:hypothetical protein EMGR_003627, partial [Emarellia grisea]